MDVGRDLESLEGYSLPQPVFVTGNAEAGSRSTGGGGHCWLLDGYQMRRRPTTTRQILKTSDIYIHLTLAGADMKMVTIWLIKIVQALISRLVVTVFITPT